MLRFREYAEKQAVTKRLIDTFGKYRVFVVPGKKVRDMSPAAQEFGGSGDHVWYPKFIPEDEIWIEDDVSEKERPTLVAAELYFLRCVAHGMSKDAAYDRMLAKEKDYRDSVRQSSREPSKTDEKAAPEVYAKRYGHVSDEDIDVFLVDGNEVRDRYKTDFIEGGHGFCYDWIPNNEIWLELGERQDEYPYILLHEYVERILMKYDKMKYDPAHKIAAKVEFYHREKGPFTKQQAIALTKDAAIDFGNRLKKNLPK